MLLLGVPDACPHRLLDGLTGLFFGQSLPIARVNCQLERQGMPNSLLMALLGEFFTAYSRQQLDVLLGALTRMHRWLARYFPVLRACGVTPLPPPATPGDITRVLASALTMLVAKQPHLAIVSHLHYADAESLQALHTLQSQPQQGLHVLASADPELGQTSSVWTALCTGTPHQLILSPFSPEMVQAFLGELAPELGDIVLARRLHQASQGQPLAVETTLRAWTLEGTLTHDGHRWSVKQPDHQNGSDGLTPQVTRVLDYLGQAARAAPISQASLCALWHLSPEETASLVTHGRLLGYLAAQASTDDERITFTDVDCQDSLYRRIRMKRQDDQQHRIVTWPADIAGRPAQQHALSPRETATTASGKAELTEAFS